MDNSAMDGTPDISQAPIETAAMTTQEAAKIKGVGPAKIDTVIPKFLDAIKAWRQEDVIKF